MLRSALLLAAPLLAFAIASAVPTTSSDAAPAEPNAEASASVEEAGVPAPDLALSANNCTYYNNASHSQIVGQFGYDCCNNPVAWGKKTRYYVCGGCFPCYPPPPW